MFPAQTATITVKASAVAMMSAYVTSTGTAQATDLGKTDQTVRKPRPTPGLSHVQNAIPPPLTHRTGVGTSLLALIKTLIESVARAVEFAAALVIGLAALQATVKAMLLFYRRNSTPTQKNEVRLTMARWLALALEFELAADILNTAVTPTWGDIEKLAAIAAIRTALNYFLEREIDAESTQKQQSAERRVTGAQADVLEPEKG